MESRHLKNFKNSANKLVKKKKFNTMTDEKEMIDSNIDFLTNF